MYGHIKSHETLTIFMMEPHGAAVYASLTITWLFVGEMLLYLLQTMVILGYHQQTMVISQPDILL